MCRHCFVLLLHGHTEMLGSTIMCDVSKLLQYFVGTSSLCRRSPWVRTHRPVACLGSSKAPALLSARTTADDCHMTSDFYHVTCVNFLLDITQSTIIYFSSILATAYLLLHSLMKMPHRN